MIAQCQASAMYSKPATRMVLCQIQTSGLLEKLRGLHRLSMMSTSSQSIRNQTDLNFRVVGTKNKLCRPDSTAVNSHRTNPGLHGNSDASILSPSAISQQWSGDNFQYDQYVQQPSSATKTTLIGSHHPPGLSPENPRSFAGLPSPSATVDRYCPNSTLQSPSQLRELASEQFTNNSAINSSNQSTYDQLERRQSRAPTKQFNSETPHDRFEAILEAAKSAGFNNFDEMVTEYYTTHI